MNIMFILVTYIFFFGIQPCMSIQALNGNFPVRSVNNIKRITNIYTCEIPILCIRDHRADLFTYRVCHI